MTSRWSASATLLLASVMVARLEAGKRAGAASSPQAVPPARLERVDESARDPSWNATRTRLLAALKRRDVAFVLAIVDPKVRTSLGRDGVGVDSFRRDWDLAHPERSELWTVLTEVLTLGGTFESPTEFCAPYVFTRFPRELDPAEYVVVVRPSVPLREQPGAASRVLTTLSSAIVRQNVSDDPDRVARGWIAVTTAGGISGYVTKTAVRSALDYRACFVKSGSDWRMTILLAGD